jgi:hypothetical protein
MLTRTHTVGGDSGAWVIENGTHRVVGHVLAWCAHNRIAYICPMQVLLEDIRRTLGAKRIFLPGSAEEAAYRGAAGERARSLASGARKEAQGRIQELEVAVEGLGIVDGTPSVPAFAAPPVPAAAARPRRSRLDLPPLNTSSESDKENLPKLRTRLLKAKGERGPGCGQGQLNMVGAST